jgi:monoamine oxidase
MAAIEEPTMHGAIYDALVIGAGYAGLAAARLLQASSRQAALLEARDRVGGRALKCRIAGDRRLEIGGQYTAPVQKRVAASGGRPPTWFVSKA